MEFHGLELDDFQVDACRYLTDGDSVVVSAPTGTGKTLIAEYAIELYDGYGQRAVYTSPIKALSNQKYMDFVRQFGSDKVGILTGDVSINPRARILVMTTEVYRNMALADPESIRDIGLLILDEVHFMNDPERGTVWEESIIFSPASVRFLALSATIPNAREFAAWISDIHGHEVRVVRHHRRAVPLEHFFYMGGGRMAKRDELTQYMDTEQGRPAPRSRGRRRGKRGKKGREKPGGQPPSHIELLKQMTDRDLLPCLFFVFSRKDCESKALEAAYNLSLGDVDLDAISGIIMEHLADPELQEMESVRTLVQAMERGVAFHHAGMLPAAKRAVEEAFGRNLIKVLYATETFAVGINYPARSVAFAGLRKYDGVHHRYLNSKEYYQMAGRAGRRGMDAKGTVITLVNRWEDDLAEIRRLTARDTIPITSRFQLSYNTVLNLIDQHSKEEIGQILERSVDSFLRRRGGERVNVWASWNNRVRVLRSLGHLRGSELTEKGRFTSKIFTQELLTAEVFSGNWWRKWDSVDMACLAAAITYEPRHTRRRKRPERGRRFHRLMSTLRRSDYLMRHLSIGGLAMRVPLVEDWASGSTFADLVERYELAEGDIIRIFRQAIDLMEQVKRATGHEELKDKLAAAVELLDKDVVSVSFG